MRLKLADLEKRKQDARGCSYLVQTFYTWFLMTTHKATTQFGLMAVDSRVFPSLEMNPLILMRLTWLTIQYNRLCLKMSYLLTELQEVISDK